MPPTDSMMFEAVAAFDLDADGDDEVIVVDGDAVHVSLNQEGGFSAVRSTRRASPRFAYGARVQAADVDGDGAADLVVECELFLGDGGGGLSQGDDACPAGATFQDVRDVDLDGRADVLYADGAGLWLLRSMADGALVVAAAEGGALVDADGDGLIDLAAIVEGDLQLVLGDGSGVFSAPPLAFPFGRTLSGAPRVAPFRFEDDTRGFVVQAAGRIVVLGFAGMALEARLDTPRDVLNALAGVTDVDGDGDDDLVGWNASISVLRQQQGALVEHGVGGFYGQFVHAVVVDDPDAAGGSMIVTLADLGELRVLGAADVAAPVNRTPVAGPAWRALVQLDVGDGGAPVFVTLGWSGNLAVVRDAVVVMSDLSDTPPSLTSLVAVDVDGFTPTELFVTTSSAMSRVPVSATPPFVGEPIALLAVDGSRGARAVDLSGDAREELAVLGIGMVSVVSLAVPDAPIVSYSSPTLARALSADGDFDGDGDVDLFATSDDSGLWLENTGTSFTEHALPIALDAPLAGAVADVDGDGAMEVISRATLLRFGGGAFTTTELPYAFDSAVMADATSDGVEGVATMTIGYASVAMAVRFAADGVVAEEGRRVPDGSRVERLRGDAAEGFAREYLVGSRSTWIAFDQARLPAVRALALPASPPGPIAAHAVRRPSGAPAIVTRHDASATAPLSTFIQSDAGRYQRAADLEQPAWLGWRAEDLDADGVDEIVALRTGALDTLRWADAAAGSLEVASSIATSLRARWPAFLVDVDRDGLRDLVTLEGPLPMEARVVLGIAGGGFDEPYALSVPDDATNLDLADTDGDGIPEVLVLSVSGVHAVDARSGVERSYFALPQGQVAIGLGSGDIDGDGREDALLISALEDEPSIQQVRELRFAPGEAESTLILPSTSGMRGVPRLADLDADGDLDAVTLGIRATVLENTDGSLGNVRALDLRGVAGVAGGQVSVTDIDGDGHLDLVGDYAEILMGSCPP